MPGYFSLTNFSVGKAAGMLLIAAGVSIGFWWAIDACPILNVLALIAAGVYGAVRKI